MNMNEMNENEKVPQLGMGKRGGSGAGGLPFPDVTAGGAIPMEEGLVGTPLRATGSLKPTSKTVGNFTNSGVPVPGTNKFPNRRFASPRRSSTSALSAPSTPEGCGTTAMKDAAVSTPSRAGKPSSSDFPLGAAAVSTPPPGNDNDNLMDKTIISLEKSSDDFSQFLDNFTETLNDEAGRSTDKGEGEGEGWKVERKRKRGKGKGGKAKKGEEQVVSAEAGTTNQGKSKNKVRVEKRRARSNEMSFSKAARVEGLLVNVRAVPDNDDAGVDADIHTLDQDDWDAIEAELEMAVMSEGLDKNLEAIDMGKDILGRGRRNHGFWVKCRNQVTVDFLVRATRQAGVPKGREQQGYKYAAYGPGEMPFVFLSVKNLKGLAWKDRPVMESFLRLYNPFLRDKHLKVVKGGLNKEEELPEGAKYFSIVVEVAEDALDDILDQGSQLRTSIYSYSDVEGKALNDWRERKKEGFPPLEEGASTQE
jgi:hypothetical protein